MGKDKIKKEDSPDTRLVSEIIGGLGPAKSSKLYQCQWQEFMDFHKCWQPTEGNYHQSFGFHWRTKKNKALTLWSKFSILNSQHQIHIGKKLQQWPHLSALLKLYDKGYYERKTARVFTMEEINAFMKMKWEGLFRAVRKAGVTLSYCGGLRTDELHKLRSRDFTEDSEGYWVKFKCSKQVGEQLESTFLVPRSESYTDGSMALKVKLYIDAVRAELGKTDGAFMKGCMAGKRLVKQPMGKNTSYKCGWEVAEVLGLPEPHLYTGLMFRQSAATEAADHGLNSCRYDRFYNYA